MYKKYFPFILLLAVLITSCGGSGKFNRILWDDGDGIDFPYRERILDDLLATHKFKGERLKSITDSLGYPQGRAKDSIYYDVDVKLDDKAKPEHIKRLVIYFGADSVITRTRVHEFFAKKKQQ